MCIAASAFAPPPPLLYGTLMYGTLMHGTVQAMFPYTIADSNQVCCPLQDPLLAGKSGLLPWCCLAFSLRRMGVLTTASPYLCLLFAHRRLYPRTLGVASARVCELCAVGSLCAPPLPHMGSLQVIEEFMLLANEHVAIQIAKALPDRAMLRSHPAPSRVESVRSARLPSQPPPLHPPTPSADALLPSLTLARSCSLFSCTPPGASACCPVSPCVDSPFLCQSTPNALLHCEPHLSCVDVLD